MSGTLWTGYQYADRTVTFRAYVTGDARITRVNKDKFIITVLSWYALGKLKQRMEGNLSYKRLFVQDINN